MNKEYVKYFLLLIVIWFLIYIIVKIIDYDSTIKKDNTSLHNQIDYLTNQNNTLKIQPKSVIFDMFKSYGLNDKDNQCATNYIVTNNTIAQLISWINFFTQQLKDQHKVIPDSAAPYIIDIDAVTKAMSTACGIK